MGGNVINCRQLKVGMNNKNNNNYKLNIMLNHMLCPNLPPVNNPIIFKADSGASKHYLKINDMHVLTHMTDVAK